MQLQNKQETERRPQKNHLKRGENREILLQRTTIRENQPEAQQERAENSTELHCQKEKWKQKIKGHPN